MVFPVYDHDPFEAERLPLVTWSLIGVNVLVFLIQLSLGGGDADSSDPLAATYGIVPAVIAGHAPNAAPIPAFATLITGMFVHAGWGHILGNMIYLWVFGDDIEEAMGRLRFLAFYLMSGIAASLVYVACNAQSTEPLVGASGAISGVLAAYLMLRPCAKVTVFIFVLVRRIQAFWVIILWVLLQIYYVVSGSDDSVAYLAHLGGVMAGAVLFAVMRPRDVELFRCENLEN
jgi:membrane associated rhomboid family serine protease